MGKYGCKKITLTMEAYNNFCKLKELLKASSWEDLSKKLLELVEKKAGCGGAPQSRVECGGVERSGVEYGTAERSAPEQSTPEQSGVEQNRSRGRRSKALDILKKQRVILLSELRLKDPEKFVKYMKSHPEEVVVIECEKDIAFVEKSFYREFMTRLKTYPVNEEEWNKLSEPERKLLRFLRENALIYIKDGRWEPIP